MVPFCSNGLCSHAHSGWWQQHGGTSVDIGTHSETHQMPNVNVPQGKHWHPAASPLPALK